jgi:hypothetical protein
MSYLSGIGRFRLPTGKAVEGQEGATWDYPSSCFGWTAKWH